MRIKDDKKQEALFRATIRLVNEIGFAASSVSKIAAEAGVSPATLYIYFKNKEDLIVSTYLEIKRDMSQTLFSGLDETLPVRDALQLVWEELFTYVTNNREEFRFTEQFANSPFHELVDRDEIELLFKPIITVIARGIEQKIIKDVDFAILGAFIFHPIMVLANPNLSYKLELDNRTVQTSFQLAWDAIKL